MGCGASALVAQAAPATPLCASAIGNDASLQLTLQADTPDDALEVNFFDETGKLVITQRRNHLPHNAVLNFPNGNCPFTGAVAAPANVTYLDAAGKICAVLQNSNNGDRSMMEWSDLDAVPLHAPADGYRNGEGFSVLYAATPPEGGVASDVASGVGLSCIGQIKCLKTEKQRASLGLDYRYLGGTGFYPLQPDGTFASAPTLKFDGTATYSDNKQCVAKNGACYGHRPAPPKVTTAAGVEALLVLALASEYDANRRGVETAPMGAFGMGG